MVSKWVTALSFVWPFVVVVNATVICYMVRPDYYHADKAFLSVVGLSLLAVPVVGHCFYRQLPTGWPESLRTSAASLLAIGMVGLETYLALLAFIFATLPLGWIG
jgi:hypothetical protein